MLLQWPAGINLNSKIHIYIYPYSSSMKYHYSNKNTWRYIINIFHYIIVFIHQ